jgi:hypothetical protein
MLFLALLELLFALVLVVSFSDLRTIDSVQLTTDARNPVNFSLASSTFLVDSLISVVMWYNRQRRFRCTAASW